MKLKLIEQHTIFEGEQRKYQHFSEILQCQMSFSIFVPKSSADESLDLVWWLSGLTCNDDNFSQKGAFQKYAVQNKLAVMIPDTSPRGTKVADVADWDLGQGAGFYLNATEEPWQKNYQMYDYLTQELAQIAFQLIPNFSGKESIMGHSMGGHGALVIGLKNPERFAAISAFAPILNPIKTPWGQKAFQAYLGENQASWKEWDATELLKRSVEIPPILITQGTADEFYPLQLKESDFLAATQKKQVELFYQKAAHYDHSYFTIATFIEKHLQFHKKHLASQKGQE